MTPSFMWIRTCIDPCTLVWSALIWIQTSIDHLLALRQWRGYGGQMTPTFRKDGAQDLLEIDEKIIGGRG